MTPWRLRPFRRVFAVTALLIAGMMAATWAAAVRLVEGDQGALPDALHAVAQLETRRLIAALAAVQPAHDRTLDALLGLARAARLPADAAAPWIPGGCNAVAKAPTITRAGVWDLERRLPVVAVEVTSQACLDRLGTHAVALLTGPPFPSVGQFTRTAQWAHLGVEDAGGVAALVAAWRDGGRAQWRWARREEHFIAFVDVAPFRLPLPPPVGGTRLDTLVLLAGEVVGYVHGGPDAARLPDALAGVQRGEVRALDLPELAAAHAPLGVLAWRQPGRVKGQVFSVVETPLETRPYPVSLAVVASMPSPLEPVQNARQAGSAWLLALLCWLVAAMAAWWPLARVVGSLAGHTREAWLGLRDDDEGSPEDLRRATAWLEVLTAHAQQVLVVALGHAERFWAPAPMARLIARIRERLKR